MVPKIKNIDSLLAFEASRKEARICRQEFEQVKKKRYDLFSQCFEHVSVSIDQIYKKLCRNNSAQVCTRGNLALVVGVLLEWPAMGQSQLMKTGYHNDICSSLDDSTPLWSCFFIWKMSGLDHLVSRFSLVLQFCCLALIWLCRTASGLCSEGGVMWRTLRNGWSGVCGVCLSNKGKGKNWGWDANPDRSIVVTVSSVPTPHPIVCIHSKYYGTVVEWRRRIDLTDLLLLFLIVFFYDRSHLGADI